MNYRFGNYFLKDIKEAEDEIIRKITEGQRIEEDHITCTFLDLLESAVNKPRQKEFVIKTYQFSGRGPKSLESITGVDGAVTLDVKLPGCEYRKSYLFQAKKLKSINQQFDRNAIKQRNKMLSLSSDSFFLVFSPDKIKFISAFIAIFKTKYRSLPYKSLPTFHRDFFNCFIGDSFARRPFNYSKIPPKYRHIFDYLPNNAKFINEVPIAKHNLVIAIVKQIEG